LPLKTRCASIEGADTVADSTDDTFAYGETDIARSAAGIRQLNDLRSRKKSIP